MTQTDDLFAKLQDLRINAANPIVAIFAQLTEALAHGCVSDDDPVRRHRLLLAQIEAVFAAFDRIPEDRWNLWSEVPKAQVLGRLRTQIASLLG